MASIADILIAKGNAQANARSQRGNIYADLIRNLSSVPGQIVQGQRQQQQFDLQQQRLGLETQRAKTEETLAQQQGELNQQRLNDARQQTEGAQELARSISAHTSTDPETGHVTIDHDAVYNEVAGKYPKVATGFIDDWEKYSNHVADTQEIMLKATRSKLAILGSLAGSVVEAPESERAMRYASMMGQAQSIFKSVPEISGELSKLPPVYTPESDARLKQIFEQSRSQADRVEEALKRSTTRKNEAEAKAAENPPQKPMDVAPDHTVIDASGKVIYTAPVKPPTPEHPAPFTLSPGEIRYDATGKPIASRPPTPKEPAAAKVTGAQSKALSYYNRAKEAADTLTDGGDTSLEQRMAKSSLASQLQLKSNFNLIQTSEQQQYRQAQRAFTEARLRKESGAQVPNAEYENDARTYFAQPGDSAATIKQKAKARETVLEGLKFESGPAYESFYGEPNISSAREPNKAKDKGPAVGTVRSANGETRRWTGEKWELVKSAN